MLHFPAQRSLAWLVVAAALLFAACGSTSVPPTPPVSASAVASTAPIVSSAPSPSSSRKPPGSATPSPDASGFAFAAEDIAAYYQSRGYACAEPQPSQSAAGYVVRTCQDVDDAGRTRVIGLVTDPDGDLANGFASVKGTETETFLAPIDALDSLAGFLGATLGENHGAALLTWLASHLGDAYAETTSGPIRVATYTASEDDHSTLYVEVANQAYLDASPKASP